MLMAVDMRRRPSQRPARRRRAGPGFRCGSARGSSRRALRQAQSAPAAIAAAGASSGVLGEVQVQADVDPVARQFGQSRRAGAPCGAPTMQLMAVIRPRLASCSAAWLMPGCRPKSSTQTAMLLVCGTSMPLPADAMGLRPEAPSVSETAASGGPLHRRRLHGRRRAPGRRRAAGQRPGLAAAGRQRGRLAGGLRLLVDRPPAADVPLAATRRCGGPRAASSPCRPPASAPTRSAYAALLHWSGLRYDIVLAFVLVAVAVITYLVSSRWAFLGNPQH